MNFQYMPRENKISIVLKKLLMLSIFFPYIGGEITNSDTSIFSIIFSTLIIVFVRNSKVPMVSFLFIAIGLITLLFNSLLIDISLVMVLKGCLILLAPTFIYYSIRYILNNSIVYLKFIRVLIKISIYLYFLILIFPQINIILSKFLFINRSLNLFESETNLKRMPITIFGEPSFAALTFTGICFLIYILGDMIYASKFELYLDLLFSSLAIISTKSITSLLGILLIFTFIAIDFFVSIKFSKIKLSKLLFPFCISSSLIYSFNFLRRSKSRFNFIFDILTASKSGIDNLFYLISSDDSIMQRILNYDLFFSNFPFNLNFFFGLSSFDFNKIALSHAHENSFGALNYQSLLVISKTGAEYFKAQTSAIPSFFFNYGTIPTICLLMSILLIIFREKEYILKFQLIPIILYMICCLFLGTSILFAFPYLVLYAFKFKSFKLNKLQNTKV